MKWLFSPNNSNFGFSYIGFWRICQVSWLLFEIEETIIACSVSNSIAKPANRHPKMCGGFSSTSASCSLLSNTLQLWGFDVNRHTFKDCQMIWNGNFCMLNKSYYYNASKILAESVSKLTVWMMCFVLQLWFYYLLLPLNWEVIFPLFVCNQTLYIVAISKCVVWRFEPFFTTRWPGPQHFLVICCWKCRKDNDNPPMRGTIMNAQRIS